MSHEVSLGPKKHTEFDLDFFFFIECLGEVYQGLSPFSVIHKWSTQSISPQRVRRFIRLLDRLICGKKRQRGKRKEGFLDGLFLFVLVEDQTDLCSAGWIAMMSGDCLFPFFFPLAGCHRFPAAIFNREKHLYMPIAVTIGVFKNKRSLRSCVSPCIWSYLYILLCNISSPCHCSHHIKTKKTGEKNKERKEAVRFATVMGGFQFLPQIEQITGEE